MHRIVDLELMSERNEVMGEMLANGVEISTVVVPAELGHAVGIVK